MPPLRWGSPLACPGVCRTPLAPEPLHRTLPWEEGTHRACCGDPPLLWPLASGAILPAWSDESLLLCLEQSSSGPLPSLAGWPRLEKVLPTDCTFTPTSTTAVSTLGAITPLTAPSTVITTAAAPSAVAAPPTPPLICHSDDDCTAASWPLGLTVYPALR